MKNIFANKRTGSQASSTESSDSSDSKPKAMQKPTRKRRRFKLNFLLLIGIIVAIALFAWAEQQRRGVVGQLEQTEQELQRIREATERRGSEVAQQVLEQVRKLIDIPTDPEPTVATIIDIDKLREASDFYQQADNGDHLIITEKRAILYDPDRNIILDVVPISIRSDTDEEGTEEDQESDTTTTTTTTPPEPSPKPSPTEAEEQPETSPTSQ